MGCPEWGFEQPPNHSGFKPSPSDGWRIRGGMSGDGFEPSSPDSKSGQLTTSRRSPEYSPEGVEGMGAFVERKEGQFEPSSA